jgi:hypothetical protein
MLWAKKLEECQASVAGELKKFLAPRLKTVKAEDVAADLMKTAVKVDMSRSAARVRRRLYAQWQRWDLCPGELVRLGPQGLELNPGLKSPDPVEMGDLYVDPFRVLSVVKMLGLGGTRLNPLDRIKAFHTVFQSIIKTTKNKKTALSERAVAVLLALHAVEANREVLKPKVQDAVSRHFGQWGVPLPDDAEMEAAIAILEEHGAVARTPESIKLLDRMGYPW